MPKTGERSRINKFLFQNSSTSQTIAKNTFWLSFGEVVGRLMRVGLIVYAARVLGAAGYGMFSYMTSLAAILTIFSDSGLSSILVREGALNEERRRVYFSTALLIKLVIILFSFGIIVFVAPSITNLPLANALIYAIGLLTIFDSLRVFGNAIFRAEEHMQFEAGANILTQLIILAGGFYALALFPSPENLAIAYAVGSGVGLVLVTFFIRKYIRGFFKYFRKDLIKEILIAGWPIGISAIFGGLLVNIDTVMIGWFSDATQVGYYSAAQKPISFLYLLPAFIIGGLFPVMARYAKSNKDKFRDVMERGLSMTILLAYPLVVGIALNARKIVEIAYGTEFLNAAIPMIILSATLIVTFPGTIIMNAIFSYDRQKEMVSMWIIGSILNVGLNFYLIPIWGIVGAALTSLVTQTLVFVVFWYKMKRINNFSILKNASPIIKSTLIIAIGIFMANFFEVSFAIVLPLSIITYFYSLRIFKDPTLNDVLATLRGSHDTEPKKT